MTRISIGEAIQQVVGVLSNVADTGEVLQAVATTARQMMQADEGYLLLREGGRLVLRAADGLPGHLVGRSSVRLGEGIEGWVADHGETVALMDASRERRFRDLPGRRGMVRALAVAPMRLRDDIVGVLATAGMDPFPPVGSRLTALQILASIAAVTIENDRLLKQERRRARQAELLLDLSGLQAQDVLSFLQRVADAINPAMGVDDTELVLLDEQGEKVVCAVRAGGERSRSIPNRPERQPGHDLSWVLGVLSAGQPLLSGDVASDPELRGKFAGSGVRSLIAVPIPVRGRKRGIVRVASSRTDRFTAEDLAFLTLIAAQVGLSVERADLSQRRLQVSREEARQQARQEFLGQVSHELKTPVAVLKAYTELLYRKAELDSKRAPDQEVLGRMLEQTDRMLAMVEQLLDLQKMETGQFSLEISRFDISDLARRVAENVQVTAPDHRILLKTPGRVPVAADRRRVEEVLLNLLDNAVKYSPEGSGLVVTVSDRLAGPDVGMAMVSVSDPGRGIPSHDLERIFERFFQGQGKLHKGHVGLGLGLYIAREIVERHGGRIWAESSLGSGSTFRFTLPLAGTEEETP
jgi:signal transduction histidine kinase